MRRGVDLQPKEPAQLGLDEGAFAILQDRAEKTRSDAAVVLVGDAVAADWSFVPPVEPIATMSITKSIVALAIGKLIDLGLVSGPDEKLSTFFPAFAHDGRAGITLRHVLSHTSGLDDKPTPEDIFAHDDFVAFAAEAPSKTPPGEKFFYSNRAMSLLTGVVKIASKKPLDEFVTDGIFDPLGIDDFVWEKDRRAQPLAFAGLSMRALDLAKIGLMLASRGMWGNRRVLSEEWVAAIGQPASNDASHFGLGFWLIHDDVYAIDESLLAAWSGAGLPQEFVDRMRKLVGRRIRSQDLPAALEEVLGNGSQTIFAKNTYERGLPDVRLLDRKTVGFRAEGFLGQHLVVYPDTRLVGVRLRRPPEVADADPAAFSFQEFPALLRAILPVTAAAPNAATPDAAPSTTALAPERDAPRPESGH